MRQEGFSRDSALSRWLLDALEDPEAIAIDIGSQRALYVPVVRLSGAPPSEEQNTRGVYVALGRHDDDPDLVCVQCDYHRGWEPTADCSCDAVTEFYCNWGSPPTCPQDYCPTCYIAQPEAAAAEVCKRALPFTDPMPIAELKVGTDLIVP